MKQNEDIKKQIKQWLMSSEIEPEIYDQYLKKSVFVEMDDAHIAYVVSSDFAKTVLFEIETTINNKIATDLQSNINFSFLTEKQINAEKNKKEIIIKNSNSPTFDNFITGPSNLGALSAVQAIAEGGTKWNPLFIYGNSGLGKTHLLKALEHHVKKYTNKVATYISSQSFRNELVPELSDQKPFERVEAIREKYQNSDFFLLDDIQFLSSSPKTTEVLFNIFNELIKLDHQIVITSDKFPEKLNGFDKRMVSRFLSGLSIELPTLDQETSINILKYKLNINSLEMTEDAQAYIATYYSDDIRKIDGIINQISFSLIQNIISSPVDLPQLELLLTNYNLVSNDKITSSLIKKIVSKEYNTNLTVLEGKLRTQPFAFGRQVAMKLCHELLKMNYTQIGNDFGGRDHSTVLSGIERVNDRLKDDKSFEKLYKKLKKTLTQQG